MVQLICKRAEQTNLTSSSEDPGLGSLQGYDPGESLCGNVAWSDGPPKISTAEMEDNRDTSKRSSLTAVGRLFAMTPTGKVYTVHDPCRT